MSLIENIWYTSIEICMLLCMKYCVRCLLNNKAVKKFNTKKIILTILISEIIILNNLLNTIILRIPLSYAISLIYIKLIFNIDIGKSLKVTSIYFILSMAVEFILSIILSLTPITKLDFLNNNIFFKTSISLIFIIILVAAFSSKRIFNKIKNMADILMNKINLNNFILFILSVSNFILVFASKNFDNKILLRIICIIFVVIIIRKTIKDKIDLAVLEEKNKNLKDSHRAYSETIEEYRTLKHNLKNELYSIKTKLPKEYQVYIDNLIIKNNRDTQWITKIDEIPEGIQGIIFLKKIEAKEKHVKLIINSVNKIKDIKNEYIDLCIILGIIIDNSIEAASNTKEKVVCINIKETEKELNIEVINKITTRVDLNKIGKKNYSTKKIKSGIGLNYLYNLKSKKIKVKFKIINDLFIVDIIYKNKRLSKK